MSRISHCPRCQQAVTVPEGIAPESVVGCPLCEAQYPLSESLALLPPALIVVQAVVAAPVDGDAAAAHAGEPLLATAPVGLADAPVGLEEAPVGLAEAPIDLAEASVDLDEHPIDLAEAAAEGDGADLTHVADHAAGDGETPTAVWDHLEDIPLDDEPHFAVEGDEPVAVAEEEGEGAEAEEEAVDFAALTGRAPAAAVAEAPADGAPPPPRPKRRRKRESHPIRVLVGCMFSGVLALVAGNYMLKYFARSQYDALHSQMDAYLPSYFSSDKHAKSAMTATNGKLTAGVMNNNQSPAAGLKQPGVAAKPVGPAPAIAPPVTTVAQNKPAVAAPAPQPEVKPDAKPEVKPLQKPDVKPAAKGPSEEEEFDPDATKPEPSLSAEPKADMIAPPEPTAPKLVMPVVTESKGDKPKPEAKPEVKPETQPEVKPEAKPAAKPEELTPDEPALEEPKLTDPKSNVKTEPKPEVKSEAKPEVKPEAKPQAKPETKPEAKPEVKPEAKPEVKPEVKPAPVAETKPEASPADRVGPRESPSFDGAALDKALTSLGEVKEVTPAAYEKLRDLAQRVTFAKGSPDDAGLRAKKQAAHDLVERIGTAAAKGDKVSPLAKQLLEGKPSANGGILLVGTVTVVGSKNGLHGAAVRMEGLPKPISVMSDQPLSLAENDRVIVLGSIINEPAKNLAGYQGSAPRVVWAGMAVKLAP